jgi:hypothetical protein
VWIQVGKGYRRKMDIENGLGEMNSCRARIGSARGTDSEEIDSENGIGSEVGKMLE